MTHKGGEKAESILDGDGSCEHVWETSYTQAAPRAPSEEGKASCTRWMKWIEHDSPCVPPSRYLSCGKQMPSSQPRSYCREPLEGRDQSLRTDAFTRCQSQTRLTCATGDTFQRKKKTPLLHIAPIHTTRTPKRATPVSCKPTRAGPEPSGRGRAPAFPSPAGGSPAESRFPQPPSHRGESGDLGALPLATGRVLLTGQGVGWERKALRPAKTKGEKKAKRAAPHPTDAERSGSPGPPAPAPGAAQPPPSARGARSPARQQRGVWRRPPSRLRAASQAAGPPAPTGRRRRPSPWPAPGRRRPPGWPG